MRLNLAKLLARVDVPTSAPKEEIQYHVTPVAHFRHHYFGRTNSGSPCLLLYAKDSVPKAPIRLTAIEVIFSIPCNITISDGRKRTENLTAITCTASDRLIQEYFAEVCETILQIVGVSPSLHEVVEAVRRLVDLFQKLSSPSRRSVIGLFGELFVIHSAKSPQLAVQAWRSRTDDRYDFSINDVRLEVKSTSTHERSHEFSLEQCTPPPNTIGVLVSLFVEASGGGVSLLDLVNNIKEQLGGDPELLLKLQKTLAEGLGENAAFALSLRFDANLAKSSLRLYELDSVPAIRGNLPAEVSKVRFRSDLTNISISDKSTIKTRNVTLAELLPVDTKF